MMDNHRSMPTQRGMGVILGHTALTFKGAYEGGYLKRGASMGGGQAVIKGFPSSVDEYKKYLDSVRDRAEAKPLNWHKR